MVTKSKSKSKSKPDRVALVIANDTALKFLVKDGTDAGHFLVPIYDVDPDIYGGDLQFNARLQFEVETGVSHELGHWQPVGNVEVADGKPVHLYTVTFLRDIVPPDGWHWCDKNSFVEQALVLRSTDPNVQQSQALATVALTQFFFLRFLGL